MRFYSVSYWKKIYLYLLYLKICIFNKNLNWPIIVIIEIKDRSKNKSSLILKTGLYNRNLTLSQLRFNLLGSMNAQVTWRLTVFLLSKHRDRHKRQSCSWFIHPSLTILSSFLWELVKDWPLHPLSAPSGPKVTSINYLFVSLLKC